MRIKIGKSIINYDTIGQGRPVIFFSGFANDMSAMKKSMEPLFGEKDNWMRIYVDHPGVGDTVVGDDINTVVNVADTMLQFVDKLMGSKKYVLGGYSFGGYISRYILNSRIDKVEGLLLITPLIRKDIFECDVDRTVKMVNYTDISRQKHIDDKIESDLGGSTLNINKDVLQKLSKSISIGEETADSFEGTFNKPALIITGRMDDTVGYKEAFKILDKYPRATYICMDKSGHCSHIQQEHLFRELVLEWIYRLEEEVNR